MQGKSNNTNWLSLSFLYAQVRITGNGMVFVLSDVVNGDFLL